MPGYLRLFRKKERVQPFLMPQSAGQRLARRLVAIPRQLVGRTIMESRSTALAFFGVGVLVLAVGVAAFKAGASDEGISVAVLPVVDAAWGFLRHVPEDESMWCVFAAIWCSLLLCVAWGVGGLMAQIPECTNPECSNCLRIRRRGFPSLIKAIARKTDPFLPIWAGICILAVAPLEGLARLIYGVLSTMFFVVKTLFTFDLKRLVRRHNT